MPASRISCFATLCGVAASCAAQGLQPIPISEAEKTEFLRSEDARCVVEIRSGPDLIMLVANGSPAVLKPGGQRRELRQLDREYAGGQFSVNFNDPLGHWMTRLTAKKQGSCPGSSCTAYAGSLEIGGPSTYLDRYELRLEGLRIEERCASRQLNRLFYAPSLLERFFRSRTG